MGFKKNHFTFICVCVCTHACHSVCVEIRGQLIEVIPLCCVGSRDQVQATRLDNKYLYLPHLTGPYNGILGDVSCSH